MPYYDANGHYDGPLRYDEARKAVMAKVKMRLKLQKKSDSELLTYSQQHVAAMDGNASFTTPTPSAVDYQALHDDYEQKLDDANMATQEAKSKTALKEAARLALEQALTDRGNYVEIACGGDAAVAMSSNLNIRNGRSPVSPLPAPVGFLASMGDAEGHISLVWDPVRRAKTYVIQESADVTPRVWSQTTIVSRSRYTVTDCTPGERRVFRIAAIGAAGQGPWSDESKKMAP